MVSKLPKPWIQCGLIYVYKIFYNDICARKVARKVDNWRKETTQLQNAVVSLKE